MEEVDLEGRSTGYWCEDSQLGGSYCHNDNGFTVALSQNGVDFDSFNHGFNTTDACARLDDGCGWTFTPRRARYVKLRANSGCAGCSNNDYVTKLKLREASVSIDSFLALRAAAHGWLLPLSVSDSPGPMGGDGFVARVVRPWTSAHRMSMWFAGGLG